MCFSCNAGRALCVIIPALVATNKAQLLANLLRQRAFTVVLYRKLAVHALLRDLCAGRKGTNSGKHLHAMPRHQVPKISHLCRGQSILHIIGGDSQT